ncbi:MAG: protein kinase [Myxococcaceae bacterium]
MGTYQLGRRLVAASGVVEAHLGVRDGQWLVLSRLSPPWTQDHTFLERFSVHSRPLSAVRAPELAPLSEFGAGGDGLWFVEETGDGEPLRALMTSKMGRLSVEESVAIIERVAQGLGALHQAGQVHGDISASSVFVTVSGKVHLLHSGLAVVAGAHPSRGPARSEPHAIAPEQVTGPSLAATDVFRMGLLLLEMLTGRSLFVAPNPMDVLGLAQKYQAVPPSVLQGVPEQLRTVLGWLLHRDPQERPPVLEVPEALQMASASLGLSTGDGELSRAFRRLMSDRQPPMAQRTTELRLVPPRPAAPPPPVPRPLPSVPLNPNASVIGRIETRRVTHEQLEAVRDEVRPSPPAPVARESQLGEHLVRAGRLSTGQLAEAQQRATMLNLSLGDTLIIDGVLGEDHVVEALGAITRTAVMTSTQLGALEGGRLPLHLLSQQDAERLVAVPLAEKGAVLLVALVDPLDAETLDELKRVTGRTLQPVRAGDRALRDAVTRLYGGVTDDDPDSWLDRGPTAGRKSDSGVTDAAQLELPEDSGVLELEGRAEVRARGVTATGLDEGQTKLVEVLLGALGEPGSDGIALVQLCGELARRMNASTTDVDKARFVAAAVVAHNLRARRPAWETPAPAAFQTQLGALALPVKALAPSLFEGLKAMPQELVELAVVCTFAFAQAGASACPAPWQPVITALRARRFPSLVLDALVRALES